MNYMDTSTSPRCRRARVHAASTAMPMSSQRYFPHCSAVRRAGLAQSACTYDADRRSSVGALQSAEGRLPGAKIGREARSWRDQPRPGPACGSVPFPDASRPAADEPVRPSRRPLARHPPNVPVRPGRRLLLMIAAVPASGHRDGGAGPLRCPHGRNALPSGLAQGHDGGESWESPRRHPRRAESWLRRTSDDRQAHRGRHGRLGGITAGGGVGRQGSCAPRRPAAHRLCGVAAQDGLRSSSSQSATSSSLASSATTATRPWPPRRPGPSKMAPGLLISTDPLEGPPAPRGHRQRIRRTRC